MQDKWWFKTFGQEFGPISYADLSKAARTGTIAPGDEVRGDDRPDWRQASSVSGLFAETRAEWLVRVLGETMGPLSAEDVADMIRRRRLLPSDRICKVGSDEWRCIGDLPKQPEPSDEALNKEPDDLESFILAVLGAPSDIRVKPSLVDLGLAQEAEPVPHEDSLPRGNEAVPPENAFRRSINRIMRSPLSVFRQALPEVPSNAAAAVTSDENIGSSQATTLLPPVERQFHSPVPQGHTITDPFRGFPWLESFLLLGGVFLALQLIPRAGSKALSAVDLRNWAWADWIAAEIAVIVILGALTIWRRR